jgi:2-methylisocitrate lyase-like PEP mutase family enzyme
MRFVHEVSMAGGMPSLRRQALSAAASILYSGPSCRGPRRPAIWEIEMKDGPEKFRALLARGGLIVAPGVYDGYSARLAEKAGFEMAATTGAGISNSLLGIDDIGVMGLSENVDHCRMLARTLSIPLTADADTGYGNPMNVHYTVQMFEEAGLAGINIEDQVHPKRCGHMPGKEVIPLVEGVKKIEAACLARRDDAFAIIARTDALAIEGIEGMLRRARAYAEAGADMIFADAIRTEDEIKHLVDAARVPVTVNMGFGIRARPTTPLISIKRLAEIGVRRVTLPRMLPAAAIHGMTRALEAMKEVIASGEPADRPDLVVDIDAIMRLMDYDAMRELERRLLATEALETKYGPAGGAAQAARST